MQQNNQNIIRMRKRLFLLLLAFISLCQMNAVERTKLNFNGGWVLKVGDFLGAEQANYKDAGWKQITLPRAFNEKEAFKVSIEHLSDTIMWYRKHFHIQEVGDRKYFIEFEGVRYGADIWLNGKKVGYTENGVMASGFDLTPYIIKGENVIAVRVDNSWNYRERTSGQRFQWNDKNFNANYGGIPKNVFLHITDKLYQTLPLYNNLKTTGIYIYGSNYDIAGKKVTVNAESQVRNEDSKSRSFRFFAKILDADGKEVGHFDGERYTLKPGETKTVKVSGLLNNAHFWSWGYGYLYTVKTLLKADDGSKIDDVVTKTGFRKTQFGEGKFYLNDRAIMMHGYAQRTSNEWPGVGMSVPAWLSDYSNKLMVESGGNLVRWMHVCPWKQDIESCDRVGLIQAMPAGDAEKDVFDRRWEQRMELMKEAIIYNRNNPSIIFYESGNRGVSREHMLQMKAIRDEFDPHGGRASGSREMLNINEAEYGGEMLYINKSKKHPMWSMEYHRDEGLRKYWDEQSYPYHKEGDGPLYRGKPAFEYNHNMDTFAASMVERWFEYWQERPGTGKRVSDGGTKIIFSDTNTHHRGEANYRSSGVTDAMRIPKDAFFAHQVMWNGWVSPEKDATYIVGHWNYKPGTIKQTEYVVSTGDEVELFINGKSLGMGERSNQWLFTWKNVPFEAGKIEAVAYTYDKSDKKSKDAKTKKETSRYAIETAGEPHHIKLTSIQNPEGFKADGADMALIQVEVVDKQGRRCPLDNRTIHFNYQGEMEWIGGLATPNEETQKALAAKNQSLVVDKNETTEQKAARKAADILDSTDSDNTFDNYIGKIDLPVECGVNRVLIRSTVNPGDIKICAGADGIKGVASIDLKTNKVDIEHYLPQMTLKGDLSRGETPSTPSYTDIKETIDITGAVAGVNQEDAQKTFDDDETTEWKSDGKPENAWITYLFTEKEKVDEITVKLTGWRVKMYPLAIFAGKKKVWEGYTYASLGYVHIKIDKPVKAKDITIRMMGDAKSKTQLSDTKELAGGKASTLDFIGIKKGKPVLRIVEIDFLKNK